MGNGGAGSWHSLACQGKRGREKKRKLLKKSLKAGKVSLGRHEENEEKKGV
jgi:hypothetical protein